VELEKILRLHSLEDGLGLWRRENGVRSEKRSMFESGYVWLSTPILLENPNIVEPILYDPNEFRPRRGVMSRYARTVVNNDFYGTVSVSDLNTFTDSATEE
jgi:hypothetical protein